MSVKTVATAACVEMMPVSQFSLGCHIGESMTSGASVFSHILEEMAHIIQTTDEGQLQFLTIEFALPAGR
jgi:hypothetical protein